MFITISHNGVTAWGYLDGEMVLHGFDDYIFINMPETASVREQWEWLWHEIRLFIHENNVPDMTMIEDDIEWTEADWAIFDD